MRELPKNAVIAGKAIPLRTDFRCWMDFQRILTAPELLPVERIQWALCNVYGFLPQDMEEAAEQAGWFLRCGEEPDASQPRERLTGWDQDFQAVWGDFKVYAGVDLRRVPYLHWWEFMSLLSSLPPDSQMKRRIAARAVDLDKIKDPQSREECRRLKELYSLDGGGGMDMDEVYAGV